VPAPTPDFIKRLHKALLGPLTDREEIWFFLALQLDRELADITADDLRERMVMRVIKRAEQEAWLGDLLDAAVTHYPTICELKTLRNEWAPVHPVAASDPYSVCLLRGSRPFINRDELRFAMRELEEDDGSRILVVHGESGTGKSYTRQYVTHRAEVRKERLAWIDLIELTNALRASHGIKPEHVARRLCDLMQLGSGFVAPKDDEQYARWNLTFCDRLSGYLSKSPQRWWIIVDGFNSVLLPDATHGLFTQLASHVESMMPSVRLILLGYTGSLPLDASDSARRDMASRLSDDHVGKFFTHVYGMRGGAFTQQDVVESTARVRAVVSQDDPRPNQTLGRAAGVEAKRVLRGESK
jgi:hypothetical protein